MVHHQWAQGRACICRTVLTNIDWALFLVALITFSIFTLTKFWLQTKCTSLDNFWPRSLSLSGHILSVTHTHLVHKLTYHAVTCHYLLCPPPHCCFSCWCGWPSFSLLPALWPCSRSASFHHHSTCRCHQDQDAGATRVLLQHNSYLDSHHQGRWAAQSLCGTGSQSYQTNSNGIFHLGLLWARKWSGSDSLVSEALLPRPRIFQVTVGFPDLTSIWKPL